MVLVVQVELLFAMEDEVRKAGLAFGAKDETD
jgi:hypothetical protein